MQTKIFMEKQMKRILIFPIFHILINFVGCDLIEPPSKKNNNEALIGSFLINGNQSALSGCTQTSTSAIPNTAISSASRTDYNVTGCNTNNLSSIGFSGDASIVSGMSGTSPSSRILSIGDLFTGTGASGDRSIEVTFSLLNSSSYFEIVTRASGTLASFDGSSLRITPTGVLIRNTGSTNTASIGGTITAPGTTTIRTFCLDAHKEASGDHFIFWPTACALVTQKTPAFTNDTENVTAGQGNKLGFILNGATVTNFKVGTRVAISGNLLSF
jgi:hypothetical protein